MSHGFPLPDVDWEPTAGFWAAAARGDLVIPRCAECAAWSWYPRERCARCGSERMPWTPVAGRGSLFSWTVVRHAFVPAFASSVPYATGLVALEEDPSVRLATRLVDCAPEDLRVDLPVRVVFRTLSFPGLAGGVVAPFFAPAV